MQSSQLDLLNFNLFMCGWKRALQRCNSNSAKIMNALEMKWGLVPLSSSFLGQEKTKKTLNKFYQKTVNLFQDKTGQRSLVIKFVHLRLCIELRTT